MTIVRPGRRAAGAALLATLLALGGCAAMQRSALFHPTHHGAAHGLERWENAGLLIGYARRAPAPASIWLMLHGNTGQATDREPHLAAFPSGDSVYVLEYPGYGQRPGKPSRQRIDAAALEAYSWLRAQFPGKPLCIAGESLGSGPASMLAQAAPPPDKLVFIVPFDTIKSVGRHYAPHAPLGLLLAGSWDNIEALANYTGPMDVFGVAADEVIPVGHARALAASRTQAKFQLLPGRHNEWSRQPGLRLACP